MYKPCPCCGAKPRARRLSGAYQVECMSCGTTQGFFATPEKAAEVWNRRTADYALMAALQAENARLRKMIESEVKND